MASPQPLFIAQTSLMASPQPASILNTDFCLQIAKRVGLKEIEKGLNFVFSPLSVHVVLSMIAAGSKGHTLEQMLQFLKSESIEELNSLSSRLVHFISAEGAGIGGPHLSFANSVWVEQSFSLKPAFRDIVNSIHKAEARAVDFQMKVLNFHFCFTAFRFHIINCSFKPLPKGNRHTPALPPRGEPNLIKNFDFDSSFLGHHIKLWEVEAGRVQLPRFKISFGFEASGIMKELGLHSPYSEQGGLTEMVDYHELSQRYSTSHLLQ
ncbi:serpin-ZX-like [Magnolia sinica]|uniref:serpin-ZX-like n=1 Tax=Magnolia sinica TaxID=86752 RepID=UPI002658257E|nr:serpin-ZX-like [Magnolia sinica]